MFSFTEELRQSRESYLQFDFQNIRHSCKTIDKKKYFLINNFQIKYNKQVVNFREHLKGEIVAFLDEIFLKILESGNSSYSHRLFAL